MPTTRRKQNATSTRSQSTLSFNNKSARITKPSVHDTTATSKKAQSKSSEPQQIEVEDTPAADTVEIEPQEQPPADRQDEQEQETISIPVQPTPRKKKAAKPSTKSSSRIHQQSVPLHEKILRHFDLSSQYGPCIGITRLSRWRRADTLGLDPPVEVLAVLLREEDKKMSQGCGKIAYIDELGGGRVGIVE
ncbi:hypothetical protein ABVK25_012453 [Lepraria finkii]|uniref:DNA polymerase delta subunit 4 n=1 Tax=Lepraria finkii TaxID=1340010 RepID=A0ABR4AE66_9LECA